MGAVRPWAAVGCMPHTERPAVASRFADQGNFSPAGLLAEAHGHLLRCMSVHALISKAFSKPPGATGGVFPTRVARRLLHLEVAHNANRHVTVPFLSELQRAVQGALCTQQAVEVLTQQMQAESVLEPTSGSTQQAFTHHQAGEALA